MTNPVQILERPVFFPNVCIVCGLNGPPRLWFVDLGISFAHYFNPMNDGAVYYCNECFFNMTTDVHKALVGWQAEHTDWESAEKIEPTYTWKDDIEFIEEEDNLEEESEESDVRKPESSGSDQSAEGNDLVSSGTSEESESDDPDSESDDSESESTEPDDAAVRTFTTFFGEGELSR